MLAGMAMGGAAVLAHRQARRAEIRRRGVSCSGRPVIFLHGKNRLGAPNMAGRSEWPHQHPFFDAVAAPCAVAHGHEVMRPSSL